MRQSLTVPEVAKALRITPRWVYEMLRGGSLPGFRVGRFWRVDPAALEEWVRRRPAVRRRLAPSA